MNYISLPTLVSSGNWLALLALLLFPSAVNGQTPQWQMAVAVGQAATRGTAHAYATTTDTAGNVYVVGSFTGTIFLGGQDLISAGGNDIFVAKWSAGLGRCIWAQRAGGLLDDEAWGVAAGPAGIYVVGYFRDTATFGAITVGGSTSSAFVTRLTDTGSTSAFTWVKPVTGQGFTRAVGVAASGYDVFVTGVFAGQGHFDGLSLTSAGSTGRYGSDDVFIAKMHDAGASAAFMWAQRAGGINADKVSSIAVQGSSVYVAGNFMNSADFGSLTMTAAGDQDAFVTKLTDSGSSASFTWTQRIGGIDTDDISALCVAGKTVYVGGYFAGKSEFGPITLSSIGSYNGFVSRLSDQGSTSIFAWTQQVAGTGESLVRALISNGTTLYAAGNFGGNAQWGSFALTSNDIDTFVTKLSDAGSTSAYNWVQRSRGTKAETTTGLSLHQNMLYTTAEFYGTAEVGAFSIPSDVGIKGSYVAMLAAGSPTATAGASNSVSSFLYPNPAHHSVTVPAAIPATALTLLDATGRTVRTATGSTLSVQGLAPGLYLLRAAAPGQPARTGRVVVE